MASTTRRSSPSAAGRTRARARRPQAPREPHRPDRPAHPDPNGARAARGPSSSSATLALLRYLLLTLFTPRSRARPLPRTRHERTSAWLLNAIRLALGAIRRNKTRAGLTVLGILIGVAAVVTVTGSRERRVGRRSAAEIDSFAANSICVYPQPTQTSGARGKVIGRLTENDAPCHRARGRQHHGRRAVSRLDRPGRLRRQERPDVHRRHEGSSTSRSASGRSAGGALDGERRASSRRRSASSARRWRRTSSATTDPVGRTVRIGRAPFRVIGVFASRGTSLFGDDQDDRVMMPIGTFRAHVVAHVARDASTSSSSGPRRPRPTTRAEAQIESILRQRHHIRDGAAARLQDRVAGRDARHAARRSRSSSRPCSWAWPPSASWSAASA